MPFQQDELRRIALQTNLADVVDEFLRFSVSGLSGSGLPEVDFNRVLSRGATLGIRGVLGGRVPTGAHNLEILQTTAIALLRKQDDGKAVEYQAVLARKLANIDWDSFGPDVFVKRFEIEYDMLCTTVMAEGLRGMWPIVTFDLMQRLDGDLLHPHVPALISRHPEPVTAEDIGLNDARRIQATFASAATELQARIPSLATLKKLVEVLERAAERFVLIATLGQMIADRWEQFQRDQAAREATEREVERFREALRDARPIEGAEDHVDAFERNRDVLKGLA